MNNVCIGIVVLLFSELAYAYDSQSMTEHQKASYSYGYQMGEVERKLYPSLEENAYLAGFEDGLLNRESALSKKQMQQLASAYELQRLNNSIKKRIANTDIENERFLLENQKKQGIIVTDSGLQYKVLKTGKGKRPKLNRKVYLAYTGKKKNGKSIFGSGANCNCLMEMTDTFTLNNASVIQGWVEGIQLMNIGAKYRFFIKPELAYGQQPMPSIEPNSILIFDIELLEIR